MGHRVYTCSFTNSYFCALKQVPFASLRYHAELQVSVLMPLPMTQWRIYGPLRLGSPQKVLKILKLHCFVAVLSVLARYQNAGKI